MRLVLPLPPSVNHAYRNFVHPKTGRRMRVTTHKAERFKREAARLATEWASQTGWMCPETGQKVVMRLWYYWPNRRRQDTHNREKLLLDALQGVLYPDDCWVLVREMDFAVDKHNPRVEIELEVMASCATESGDAVGAARSNR